MTSTLFIGTDKGLFRCRVSDDGQCEVSPPALAGYTVNHVHISATNRSIFAAANHSVWGAAIQASTDNGATWSPLPATPHHPAGRHSVSVKSIWFISESGNGETLYAGIDPAGLFASRDQGESWIDVASLNEHATRATWEPSRGIFAVHSIQTEPAEPLERIYLAISAGGGYRSDDAGASWRPINAGVRAVNLPAADPASGHNVHRLIVHPARDGRLYRQCYTGTYRSDDHGDSWHDIGAGLPSDFGYAIAADPADPDRVFQVPLSSTHMRAPPDGNLRVYRSDDAGETWRSSAAGLPECKAWVSVLREAMTVAPGNTGAPCRVFFGTTSGHVFASFDAGDTWLCLTEFLPRVLCIAAAGDTATA